MNTYSLKPVESSNTFADRIKLLIQRVGSATEIARMCGFSEGVVRSWRDGNTDPSRARCVTLARTLGISLVWLVAGEGSIQADPNLGPAEEQGSSETTLPRQRGAAHLGVVRGSSVSTSVDSERLNTAMKMLQSELDLASSDLTLADTTDLLSELYAMLAPGGANVDAHAMLGFNQRLAQRIRAQRSSGV